MKNGTWSNGRQNNTFCVSTVDSGDLAETAFPWDVAAKLVVSPNGRKIAFSTGHSPIYILQLTGNGWQHAATIESGGYPTWSPDGTSIAFVSDDDKGIWLANADGTDRVRLAPTSQRIRSVWVGSLGKPDALLSKIDFVEWSPTAVPYGDSDPGARGSNP